MEVDDDGIVALHHNVSGMDIIVRQTEAMQMLNSLLEVLNAVIYVEWDALGSPLIQTQRISREA